MSDHITPNASAGMNNIDKAAQTIADHNADGECHDPECLAHDLADAGLLMPDLPEPDSHWRDPEEAEWSLDDGEIYIGLVSYYGINNTIDLLLVERATELTSAQARDLALALLAAANHAEENA